MCYDEPSEMKDNKRVYIREWVNPRPKGKRVSFLGCRFIPPGTRALPRGRLILWVLGVAYKHYLQCNGV